jgi:hypothetical protein
MNVWANKETHCYALNWCSSQIEEEELEEKEAIEEKLEDLHNNAPNAFVNGESKQNSDNESELPWVKLGHWVNAEGNGDAAKYEVWLALPLVLLLLVAAYRCKPRRGGGQRRSPRSKCICFAS